MTNPIVLIDFSSIAHPIWHTSANEMDPNAMSTAIVAKVRALASGQPHVALCLDSRKSFRKELDATYKASRESKPEAFWHQCKLALETLRGDGFPCWEAEGFEADDAISSAVFHCEMLNQREGVESRDVLIITSDKDLLQLVREWVTVKNSMTGNIMDAAACVEKFGVNPNQIQDWLSIVGDASDGVVGVKGIGAKGASALLNTFGNLDDLYAAIDKGEAQIKPAQFVALNEFRPRLPVVRQLLALRTDAPIPFDQILAPRVAADAAVFGGDEDPIMDDINEAMPTVTPAARTELRQAVEEITKSALDTLKPSAEAAPAPYEAAPMNSALASEAAPSVSLVPVEFNRELEPRNIGQAKELSNWMFQSRIFSQFGTPQAVMSAILAGRELGIPAMASLRAMHIIDGKPALAADFIRALVLRSGLVEYFRCIERTNERATFEAKRKGDPAISITYTVEDAKAAGVVKPGSAWVKSPADMCVARSSSKLARLVAPEVVFGVYSPEEFD